MRVVPPDDAGFAAAVTALAAGQVIAYPTETVYGLGVDPLSESALDALYRVKERDPANPVLVVIGAIEQLDALVDHVPASARRCIDRFWPGPLSLLFPSRAGVPSRVTNADGQICVRYSSHAIAARLAREFGRGITSTSANPAGRPPAVSPGDVPRRGVEICIDGGPYTATPVSTVYDSESDQILREGAISRSELDAALGNS